MSNFISISSIKERYLIYYNKRIKKIFKIFLYYNRYIFNKFKRFTILSLIIFHSINIFLIFRRVVYGKIYFSDLNTIYNYKNTDKVQVSFQDENFDSDYLNNLKIFFNKFSSYNLNFISKVSSNLKEKDEELKRCFESLESNDKMSEKYIIQGENSKIIQNNLIKIQLIGLILKIKNLKSSSFYYNSFFLSLENVYFFSDYNKNFFYSIVKLSSSKFNAYGLIIFFSIFLSSFFLNSEMHAHDLMILSFFKGSERKDLFFGKIISLWYFYFLLNFLFYYLPIFFFKLLISNLTLYSFLNLIYLLFFLFFYSFFYSLLDFAFFSLLIKISKNENLVNFFRNFYLFFLRTNLYSSIRDFFFPFFLTYLNLKDNQYLNRLNYYLSSSYLILSKKSIELDKIFLIIFSLIIIYYEYLNFLNSDLIYNKSKEKKQ